MQILLVNGGNLSGALDSTEIFDPSLGSWRAGAALPHPMYNMRAANIDNRVLIFGMNILLAYYKIYVKAHITNTLAGGWNKGTTFNTILEYDITGDSYTQIGTMANGRSRSSHAISVVKYEDFSEWCQ